MKIFFVALAVLLVANSVSSIPVEEVMAPEVVVEHKEVLEPKIEQILPEVVTIPEKEPIVDENEDKNVLLDKFWEIYRKLKLTPVYYYQYYPYLNYGYNMMKTPETKEKISEEMKELFIKWFIRVFSPYVEEQKVVDDEPVVGIGPEKVDVEEVEEVERILDPYLLEQERILDPYFERLERILDPYYVRPGRILDPYFERPGRILDPYYVRPGRILDPYYGRVGKILDPYFFTRMPKTLTRTADGYGYEHGKMEYGHGDHMKVEHEKFGGYDTHGYDKFGHDDHYENYKGHVY